MWSMGSNLMNSLQSMSTFFVLQRTSEHEPHGSAQNDKPGQSLLKWVFRSFRNADEA